MHVNPVSDTHAIDSHALPPTRAPKQCCFAPINPLETTRTVLPAVVAMFPLAVFEILPLPYDTSSLTDPKLTPMVTTTRMLPCDPPAIRPCIALTDIHLLASALVDSTRNAPLFFTNKSPALDPHVSCAFVTAGESCSTLTLGDAM